MAGQDNRRRTCSRGYHRSPAGVYRAHCCCICLMEGRCRRCYMDIPYQSYKAGRDGRTLAGLPGEGLCRYMAHGVEVDGRCHESQLDSRPGQRFLYAGQVHLRLRHTGERTPARTEPVGYRDRRCREPRGPTGDSLQRFEREGRSRRQEAGRPAGADRQVEQGGG